MKQLPPPIPRHARESVSESLVPPGFAFPRSYAKLFEADDFPDIEPMFWLLAADGEALSAWTRILAEQFPDRVLVPFAKDGGSDDVYCFDGNDKSGNPIVLLIHSFTTPGWEYRGEWFNFDSWYAGAREFHESWLKGEVEDFETGTRKSSEEQQ